MSFDIVAPWDKSHASHESQSLSSRAMSFDMYGYRKLIQRSICLNPFRAGRCLSTIKSYVNITLEPEVSIPFEQGDVFRPNNNKEVGELCLVSIPFEQGDVFRRCILSRRLGCIVRLNPFRAGRCLSTAFQELLNTLTVSIPFEQGDVFRRNIKNYPI